MSRLLVAVNGNTNRQGGRCEAKDHTVKQHSEIVFHRISFQFSFAARCRPSIGTGSTRPTPAQWGHARL